MRAARLACPFVALIAPLCGPVAGAHAQTPYPAPYGTPAPYGSQPYTVQPLSDSDLLANEIRALAANPLDLNALVRAGELAVKIGDTTAAATFFARAERIDPRNGRVKAGEASLLVTSERPGEALRRFAEAESLGADVRSFAADRGLAYDLIGQQDRAQRDYRLALRSAANDETQRRYALSLGISGKRELALAQIDPLLRKSDRGAWRARAFILAMAGDRGGAERIATSMMPGGLSQGLQPFFALLPTLSPADRAFAVHFGEVRSTPERQFDARLVPPLAALPPDPTAPVLAAPASRPVQVARDDRRRDRRRARGGDRIVVATATPPVPLPVPPPYRSATSTPPYSAAAPPPQRATTPPVTVANVRATPQPTPPAYRPAVPPAARYATSSAPLPQAVPARGAPPAAVANVLPAPQPTRSTASPAPAYPGANGSLPQPEPVRNTPPVAVASVRSSALPAPLPGPGQAGSMPLAASPAPLARVAPAPVLARSQPTFVGPSLPSAGTTVAATSGAPAPTLAPVTPAQAPAVAPATVPIAVVAQATPVAAPTTVALPPSSVAPLPAGAAPAASPLPAPAPAPVRSEESILASILSDIKVPPSELEGTATAPAPEPNPGPDPAAVARAESERRLAERKAADEKAAEQKAADKKLADKKLADKKAADKKAADAKALAEKKAAEEKRRNDPKILEPARFWVQVAGGASERDLAKEWARVRGKAATAFKGRQGWTTPLRATNRVLTGPFKTEGEAQAFVNAVAKDGISGFVFASEAGQKVDKLPAK